MNRLSQALSLTGENSQAALEGFKGFADQLEITTNIADDVILQQVALAKSFGITNDQARELVAAAADLSAATGDDLETSVRTLGKTYAGVTGKLDEQVTALKGLTKEQLRNGDAIAIVSKRYKGSAAKAIDTFAGSIESAKNAFGNFQEAIGEAIVSSPQIVTAAKEIAAAFNSLTGEVEGSGLKEAISTTVNAALAGLSAISDFAAGVGRILEVALQVATRAFSGILLLAEGFLDNFSFVTAAIDKAINVPLAGIKLLVDSSGSITELFGGDTSGLEKLSEKVGGLKTNLEGLYDENVTGGVKGINDRFVDFAVGVEESVDSAIGGIEDFAISVEGAAGNVASASQKVTDNTKAQSAVRKGVYEDEAKAATKAFEDELKAAEKIDAAYQALRLKTLARGEENEKKAAEETKKAAEKLRDDIEAIAANPIAFTIKAEVQALDLDESSKKLAAGIAGGIDAALNGREGAKNLISGAAGAFADALIPGLGPAITSIVGKLAEGPEATKQFVREFVAAVPDIVEAIAESAPVFVEALVDSLINEGGAIRIGIAITKAMHGEGVWKAIGKQIGAEFGNNFQSGQIRKTIADGFKIGVGFSLQKAGVIGAGIAGGFKTAVADTGNALKTALSQFVFEVRALPVNIGKIGTVIQNAIHQAGIDAKAAFTGAVDFIKTQLPGIVSAAFRAGLRILLDGLRAGIEGAINLFKREIPLAFQAAMDNAVSSFKTNVSPVFDEAFTKIKNAFAEGIKNLALPTIPTPPWLQQFVDAVNDLVNAANPTGGGDKGGFAGFVQDVSEGDASALDPTTYALTGGGGDADMAAVLSLLGSILDAVSEPQTAKATVQFNSKTLADIILQLNRNGARLTA
jgi:hypothetical protein